MQVFHHPATPSQNQSRPVEAFKMRPWSSSVQIQLNPVLHVDRWLAPVTWLYHHMLLVKHGFKVWNVWMVVSRCVFRFSGCWRRSWIKYWWCAWEEVGLSQRIDQCAVAVVEEPWFNGFGSQGRTECGVQADVSCCSGSIRRKWKLLANHRVEDKCFHSGPQIEIWPGSCTETNTWTRLLLLILVLIPSEPDLSSRRICSSLSVVTSRAHCSWCCCGSRIMDPDWIWDWVQPSPHLKRFTPDLYGPGFRISCMSHLKWCKVPMYCSFVLLLHQRQILYILLRLCYRLLFRLLL